MTQIVGTVFDGSTSATSHNVTVPTGVTTGMTGLFLVGTGSSVAVTITLSKAGATFTKHVEQNAGNTRVAIVTATNLAAGDTVNVALSSSAAVTIGHYYQDEYTFSGSPSVAIRSVSSATTVSGSITPASGQKVAVLGVERTTTATTLSSATSSGGEAITQVFYGEGTGSAQASVYAGTFVASAASARTATISYSNSSANGFAALFLTTGGGGGGEPPPSGGGQYTTPGQALNIGKGSGKNHFNLGVGARSGHVDITENALEAGYVRNPSGGDAAFYLNADSTAVRMEVPLDGGRTSANTSYPRVELRELQPGGSGDSDTPKAAWAGASGDHYMTGRSRVVKVPPNKPEVVLAQIHGGSDDTAKIKWRGTGSNASVIATYGDDDYATIASGVAVGTEYRWKIQALNGSIRFYWINMSTPAVTISDAPLVDGATQYFKAGAYSQSNQTTDSVSSGPCIVELRDLEAWHTGYPPPATPAGPPTVNAGVDTTITVGATFARTASEVTNGSNITARTWKIQAGPVGVNSTIDSDANLAWTPTVVGTYTLRYTATNASGASSDDAVITVVAQPVDPDPGGGTGTPVYELKYPDGTPYPTIGTGSTTVSVSTAGALTTALAAATAGQKIVLANGTYSGDFIITGKQGSAASGISIEAATTGGAVFASGSTFQIKDCQHVTVKGLSFPYDVPGDTFQMRGVARWVRVTRCTFGPSSIGTAGTEAGNYIYVGDDVSLFRIDHNTLRNKANSGNGIRVYGNFDKVDAGNGATAGCTYGRIDHNEIYSIKPEVGNDKEPIRYGVSTMSRTVANAVIERNWMFDCVCEPEVISVKMGRIRTSGNTIYRCIGGPVIRHGTDSIMSDNYVIDGNNTFGTTIGSGGARFYDAGHDILNNYFDGLSGAGNFQRSLLLDTGDAEGTSTALANHWRVINAIVDRNVIVNSLTGIVVGDNYSTAPTGCTVTNNITAGITGAGTWPINNVGGITLQSSTVTNNTHYATPTAGGFTQDADGIWRKTGFGPRMTYIKQTSVGPANDLSDTDGTGTPLAGGGGGGTPGAPQVNAGGGASILVGETFNRTATETGSSITGRRWSIEAGPVGAGTTLSSLATVSWTPAVVGVYTLRYSATNVAGTGTSDIAVIVSTGSTSTGNPPVFVASTATSGESAAVDTTAPAGLQPGMAQVVVISSVGAETISAVPSGWTLWDQADVVSGTGDAGGPMTAWVYTSTTATGPASWTKSGTRKWHAVRLAYSGQGGFGVHLKTAEATASTSHPTPTVTPATGTARVVGIVVGDRVNSQTGPFTLPAGWTQRYNQTITVGTENLSTVVADVAAGDAPPPEEPEEPPEEPPPAPPAVVPARVAPVSPGGYLGQFNFSATRYILGQRFELDQQRTIDRFYFTINGEGSSPIGGRSGYGAGNGGRWFGRITEVDQSTGFPTSTVLASETVAAATAHSRCRSEYGLSATMQIHWVQFAPVTLQPGKMYAFLLSNTDSNPGSGGSASTGNHMSANLNWATTSGGGVAALGPNGRNNVNPAATGATCGLGPRETTMWSDTSGSSWKFGDLVGWYDVGDGQGRMWPCGYRVANGLSIPIGWPCVNWPGTASGRNIVFRNCPKAVTLTRAGGACTSGGVGTVTVTNLTTGTSGSTSSLGVGMVSGNLSTPVPVAVGQSYRVAASGTTNMGSPTSGHGAVFDLGTQLPWDYTSNGSSSQIPMLYATPHPFYQ